MPQGKQVLREGTEGLCPTALQGEEEETLWWWWDMAARHLEPQRVGWGGWSLLWQYGRLYGVR